MTIIRTKRLIIRNWQERDRAFFHRINSDDKIMEFFPFRRDRAASDALMDEMRADIAAEGCGWTAAEEIETGECIGFIGLHPVEIEGVAPQGSYEIGWRLAPEFWGKGFATEGARALVDFAFDTLSLDEVISFAVWNNRRSTAVMERLGMRYDRNFDHPSIPETHPHLRQFKLYRLRKADWKSSASPV